MKLVTTCQQAHLLSITVQSITPVPAALCQFPLWTLWTKRVYGGGSFALTFTSVLLFGSKAFAFLLICFCYMLEFVTFSFLHSTLIRPGFVVINTDSHSPTMLYLRVRGDDNDGELGWGQKPTFLTSTKKLSITHASDVVYHRLHRTRFVTMEAHS